MTIQKDFPLEYTLWYKIGGEAKYLLTCKNKEDVLEAFDFVQKNSIEKIIVVGQGSNLIFTDGYFDGSVIQLSSSGKESIFIDDDGLINVFGGVTMDELINFSFENFFVGLEWAGGLPGTVGGAVRGNAGAYGGEIKDSFVIAEVLDYSGEKPITRTITKEDMRFSYRNSFIKENKKMVVISAKFMLYPPNSDEMEDAYETYERNIQNRKINHPLEYPNTGSVFINPREKEQIEKILSIYPDLRENVEKKWYGKVAVAALIDKWGMKGYRVGDAQISEKHALFIVNLDHAKAKDVLHIIDNVKRKFFNTFGFELHVEVEIVR